MSLSAAASQGGKRRKRHKSVGEDEKGQRTVIKGWAESLKMRFGLWYSWDFTAKARKTAPQNGSLSFRNRIIKKSRIKNDMKK